MFTENEEKTILDCYMFYPNGEIWSHFQKRNLIQKVDRVGYRCVKLKIAKSTYKNFYVHRLVAYFFVENPNGLNCVNHKDMEKSNNNSENLEWCTHQQNVKHAWDNDSGSRRSKAREASRKIHKRLWPIIKKASSLGLSQRDIAELLETSQPTVSYILNDKYK